VTSFRWIDLPASASISSGSIDIYDVSDFREDLVVSIPVIISIVDVSRGHQDFATTFEPMKTNRFPGAVPKDFQFLKRDLGVPIQLLQYHDSDDESPHVSPRGKSSGSSPFTPAAKGKSTPGGATSKDGEAGKVFNPSRISPSRVRVFFPDEK